VSADDALPANAQTLHLLRYLNILNGIDSGHHELGHGEMELLAALRVDALVRRLLYTIMQEPILKVPLAQHKP
jgi:hypothetical protein